MTNARYIPESIAHAILENRRQDHLENAHLDAEFEEYRQREPQHLVSRNDERADTLDIEREFWRYAENDELEEFLFDELLNALHPDFPGHEWASLPKGYEPLVAVLEFERHFDFEGWTAIPNEGEAQMQDVVKAFIFFGNFKEAKALKAVLEAYQRTPDSDIPEFHERMDEAYRSVAKADRGNGDERMELVYSFIRRHPEHFWSAET